MVHQPGNIDDILVILFLKTKNIFVELYDCRLKNYY